MSSPLFSIITVSYKDAWNLSKTMQSVFSQNSTLFEYIVIDGNSHDETDAIIKFWEKSGRNFTYIKERDTGVYDAMNKGIDKANGDYICFMNAGDRFKEAKTLDKVKNFLLNNKMCDLVLGSGQLGDDYYLPWLAHSEAYVIASLGFCHQSLYVKTNLLKLHKFDSRKGKTDSDSLQLASLLKSGANLVLLDEVLAVRSEDPGISANVEKTKASNVLTITEFYPEINAHQANILVDFRQKNINDKDILSMLGGMTGGAQLAVAILIFDVLVVKPKKTKIEELACWSLIEQALHVIKQNQNYAEILYSLEVACRKATSYYEDLKLKKLLASAKLESLEQKESRRIESIKVMSETEVVVSLTSFPKRFNSLHLVLQSLFNQTVKPKKVILHLAMSEVRNLDWIPEKIKKFKKEGLEIVGVDTNYFQYNKFYFTSEINKTQPVITVDDDVIYPFKMIEKLLEFHAKNPTCVIANRNHKITYSNASEIMPYANWQKEFVEVKPSHNNFATGVGGVLYPVGFFDDFCLDTHQIMRYAPYADDVWLKVVALKRGIKVVTTDLENHMRWYCGYTPETSENALQEINVATGMNDKQFFASLTLLENYKTGLDLDKSW